MCVQTLRTIYDRLAIAYTRTLRSDKNSSYNRTLRRGLSDL